MRPRSNRSAGISLVELAVAIAVTALVTSLALGPIASSLPQLVRACPPATARDLAVDLLEETISKPFTGPNGLSVSVVPWVGPRTGTVDVDDMNAYDEGRNVANGSSLDPTGAPIPGGGEVSREVFSVPVSYKSPGGDPADAGSFLRRIEVTARVHGGRSYTFATLRADEGRIIPPPRGGLVGAQRDLSLDASWYVVNRTGTPASISGVTVYWSQAGGASFLPGGPRITFTEIAVNGQAVLAAGVPTFDQGFAWGIAPPFQIGFYPGFPSDFGDRFSITGFATTDPITLNPIPVSMGNRAFTVVLSSGRRSYQVDVPPQGGTFAQGGEPQLATSLTGPRPQVAPPPGSSLRSSFIGPKPQVAQQPPQGLSLQSQLAGPGPRLTEPPAATVQSSIQSRRTRR